MDFVVAAAAEERVALRAAAQRVVAIAARKRRSPLLVIAVLDDRVGRNDEIVERAADRCIHIDERDAAAAAGAAAGRRAGAEIDRHAAARAGEVERVLVATAVDVIVAVVAAAGGKGEVVATIAAEQRVVAVATVEVAAHPPAAVDTKNVVELVAHAIGAAFAIGVVELEVLEARPEHPGPGARDDGVDTPRVLYHHLAAVVVPGRVVDLAAKDVRVVAQAAVHRVDGIAVVVIAIVEAAVERVVAIAADDRVGAVAAVQYVVANEPFERVVAGAAVDRVVACRAAQRIIAVRAVVRRAGRGTRVDDDEVARADRRRTLQRGDEIGGGIA